MLVQLEPGVLLTVGCGKCGEPASEAERARNPAHHHDRGAAGRRSARNAAHADVAVHSGHRVLADAPGIRPNDRGSSTPATIGTLWWQRRRWEIGPGAGSWRSTGPGSIASWIAPRSCITLMICRRRTRPVAWV